VTTVEAPTCPTCHRPTEHIEPHFGDDELCICGCCTCETTTGCCCTKCPCDGAMDHRARIARRVEDEGLTAAQMDQERERDEAEADQAAARAYREGRDE
jgi:hypothetical protein